MGAVQFPGVLRNGFEQVGQGLLQWCLAQVYRIGNHRLQAIAAGLEFVVTGNMGLFGGMLRRTGAQQPTGKGLGQGCQRGRLFDGQRRIADAYFNRAEFRFRADVPIQILDALGDATGLQEGKVFGEFLPTTQRRALSAQRKG